MRRSIIAISTMFSVLMAMPIWAKENSFAQKDASGHLLAYLTEGEDLPQKLDQSYFGLPNTGLIMSVHQNEGQIKLRFEAEGELTYEAPVALSLDPKAKVSAWPMFVKLNGLTPEQGYAYLLGVVVERSAGYSGGGASERWLHLLRVDNPGAEAVRAREVLTLPLTADKLIRACFSEQDEKTRQDVCHDHYEFEAFLRLDEKHQGDWPAFVYQTQANAQPDPKALSGKTSGQSLATEDLARKGDLACSFQSQVQFNPMSRRYEMASPGPDCSDYFVPTTERLYSQK